MDGRVEGLAAHLAVEQVEQAVFRQEHLAVQVQAEPGVQVGVAPQPLLDVLRVEPVTGKALLVREEFDERPVLFAGVAFALLHQQAAGEHRGLGAAVAEGGDREAGGQGVHRLGAHAVQAHRELEHLGVVLGAGIDHGHALHHLAQWNAAAVVAHPAEAVLTDVDVDALAKAHDVLVDRVVQDLLEQDVDAVVRVGTVAEATDVHARPLADVLQRTERLDLGFVVGVFTHGVQSARVGLW